MGWKKKLFWQSDEEMGSWMLGARWREDTVSLKAVDSRKDSTWVYIMCVCVWEWGWGCCYWPLQRSWIKVANMLQKQGAKILKVQIAKDLFPLHRHHEHNMHIQKEIHIQTHTQGTRTKRTSVPVLFPYQQNVPGPHSDAWREQRLTLLWNP